jgi:tRNA threonylcarbamoyl adenosine modification protein YeaZ
MRLLVIDTSADRCAVGVAIDDRAPVVRQAEVGRAHAERLMPMVEEAMAAAGLDFADLSRIAVTIGPGSFTGVRIGVAAARGLALATGAKAVGIGTLAVHAEAARAVAGAVPVVVAIAASRGEIYAQRFVADGSPDGPPQLGAPETFAGLTTALAAGAVVLAGSGAGSLAAATGGANRIVHRDAVPDVSALLRLALRAPETSGPPRPVYLRPPDAKPQGGAARLARR